MTRIYIAGPMSGLPHFNFPAFYAVAEALRAQGHDVVSPAELDDAEDAEMAKNSPDGSLGSVKKTWGDFLARDVKLLADGGITAIAFLPGWEKSKGAKLEAFVGVLGKLDFFAVEYTEGTINNDAGEPVSYTQTTIAPRDLGWVVKEIAAQWAYEIAIHAPLPFVSLPGSHD